MFWDLVQLPWLAAPPADLSGAIAAIEHGKLDCSWALRGLASCRLSRSGVRKLARAIERCGEAGRLPGLSPVRLGVLANATLDTLEPDLVVAAARHGVALSVIMGPYDQAVQVATDAASPFHQGLDLALLALHHAPLSLASRPADAEAAEETLDFVRGAASAVVAGLRDNGCPAVIVQTLAPPPDTLFGNLDSEVPGTVQRGVARLNDHLRDLATAEGGVLLDVAAVAARAGLHRWHDPVDWAWAKVPVSRDCTALYADHLGRLLGALKGRARRALVLDLDNTLWGGVIGDDGIDGIELGPGSPAGETHQAVQRAALRLRERGVLLAVSSKNTDAVARRAFAEHPEMLLREEHIAVFQANWEPKPRNIEAIAATLSLGLESFVFLDDNPAERAAVREALPQVAVPELPDEPALFAPTLLAAGYFESASFTAADRERARQYSDNARRAEFQASTYDQAGFLRSLKMQARCSAFDEVGRPRVTQLINKSNQFNLTTRRYSEADVAALEADPDSRTLQVRLSDRFGDNGMVSVVIVRPSQGQHLIDTWLMSCRVLGRRLDELVLDQLVTAARADGATALVGEYLPTARNDLVRDHYSKLGFVALDDEGRLWKLEVDGYEPRRPPIELREKA